MSLRIAEGVFSIIAFFRQSSQSLLQARLGIFHFHLRMNEEFVAIGPANLRALFLSDSECQEEGANGGECGGIPVRRHLSVDHYFRMKTPIVALGNHYTDFRGLPDMRRLREG